MTPAICASVRRDGAHLRGRPQRWPHRAPREPRPQRRAAAPRIGGRSSCSRPHTTVAGGAPATFAGMGCSARETGVYQELAPKHGPAAVARRQREPRRSRTAGHEHAITVRAELAEVLGHPLERRELDRAGHAGGEADDDAVLHPGIGGDSSSVRTSARDTVSTRGQCTMVGTRSGPNLSVISATITPARLHYTRVKGKTDRARPRCTICMTAAGAGERYLSHGAARERPSVPPRTRRH